MSNASKKIRNWKQFFDGVGVKCPSDNDLFSWLLEALANSERRGYHRRHLYLKKPKKQVNNTGSFDKFDDMGDAWEAKKMGKNNALVSKDTQFKKPSNQFNDF